MKMEMSYIAPDVQIEGRVFCSGALRVDGNVDGALEGEASITCGTSSQVRGTIHAATVIVNGRVEGEIVANAKLSILAQGRVNGDVYIATGGISISKGGDLNGRFLPNKSWTPPEEPVLTLTDKIAPEEEVELPEEHEEPSAQS